MGRWNKSAARARDRARAAMAAAAEKVNTSERRVEDLQRRLRASETALNYARGREPVVMPDLMREVLTTMARELGRSMARDLERAPEFMEALRSSHRIRTLYDVPFEIVVGTGAQPAKVWMEPDFWPTRPGEQPGVRVKMAVDDIEVHHRDTDHQQHHAVRLRGADLNHVIPDSILRR